LDGEGNQLTPPIFLNTGGLEGKQTRLRTQIDHLKAKRDKLPKDQPDRAKIQAEINHCWRKYEARNKTIAHFASTVIICLAVLYECDTIAGEWLKTLKVKKEKNGRGKKARFRNWRISTTVREAMATKVAYKAQLLGKKHLTVWPRGTSHECPRCGEPGITTRSPEHTTSIRWGEWFRCKKCGFNGDRDYVAAVNIGRRGLWEKQKIIKPASYSGAGAALLFPSRLGGKFARKLSTTLSGLSQVVQLRPKYVLLC
jgi:transposase